jgi:hypothetical protein
VPGRNNKSVVLRANPKYSTLVDPEGVGGVDTSEPSTPRKYGLPADKEVNPVITPEA